MKNKFKVNGETTILYIERHNDTTLEVLIDTAQLSKLIELGKTWGVTKNGYRDEFVVQAFVKGAKNIKLHRFLTNAPDNRVVLHKNKNTLDNRLMNLELVSRKVASRVRKSVNRNSSTGVRGVTFDVKRGKYKAYLYINGKQKHLGTYNTLDEAKQAVHNGHRMYFGRSLF